MKEKIEAFARLVEAEQLARLSADGMDCDANKAQARTRVVEGRVYTKVNVGSSGKFMIDKAGQIFGIKAYGQVHKGHCYGTLDTTDQFQWGDYSPRRKAQVNVALLSAIGAIKPNGFLDVSRQNGFVK